MQIILLVLDLLGTLAFAVSGALVAIRRRMDIFGVLVLAIVTATGGGILRDVIMGSLPPVTFLNPLYAGVSALTGLVVFLVMYFHPKLPQRVTAFYDWTMFIFDTLGVAAFTVDGVALAVNHGYRTNFFLMMFLGVITGVGGGVMRDILADRMPDILRKHVYALASVLGAVVTSLLIRTTLPHQTAMIAGFAAIVLLRVLAARFRWDLPKVQDRREEP